MNSSSLSKALIFVIAGAVFATLSALTLVLGGGMVVAPLAACLLAMAGGIYFLLRARDVIRETREFMRAATAGDFEKRLTDVREKGDLGRLQHEANDLIDHIDAYVRESAAAMAAVHDHKYYRRILPDGLGGALRHGATIMNEAMVCVEKRIRAIEQATSAFEVAVGSVATTLGASAQEMRDMAQSVDRGARATSTQAVSVAAAAEQATVSVEDVARSSTRLSESGARISGRVSHSARIARRARENLVEMDAKVRELSEAAGQISRVITLIQTIAAQTNLLALNATIEAARAGEAGKGFAVVANEVKSLASQTANATNEIASNVERVCQATDHTIEAIAAIAHIVSQVDQITNEVMAETEGQSVEIADIAHNISQAAVGTKDVAENILDVSQTSDTTMEIAARSLETSARLSGQSEVLVREVEHFIAELKRGTSSEARAA